MRVVLLVCLALAASARAEAVDYYVSSGGADASAGTTKASPWRTLARVNAVRLRAGDRVLLRAGDTFFGGLSLDQDDAGTAAAPIVITTYNEGRAAIWAGGGTAIAIYNTSGISIENLAVAGGGGSSSGISIYTDLVRAAPLPFIRIHAVDVGGFARDGIEIGTWFGGAGFSGIRVTDTEVHHNGRNGLFTYADRPNVHRRVYVGGVRAYENHGTPGLPSNSGSGIVLGSVDGATIERSVAHDNGRLCDAVGGPVGIWTYDSTRVVIQHNESYRNRTAAAWDGGGFDLDRNVSDSIVQYNYSHDNDGAGFLLAHSPASDAHARNVIRYNVSQNDGRANSYGAIEIWGRVQSAEIFHNTVIVSAPAAGLPPAVRVSNTGVADRFVSGVHLRNNILVTAGLPIVQVEAAALAGASDLRFDGNAYDAGGAPPQFRWGVTTLNGLEAWRSIGQESLAGMATGIAVDPQLDGHRLRPGSPMVDAAIDLRTWFGIDPGATDFFDGPVGLGGGFDIGAHELADASAEIVIHAGLLPPAALHGNWTIAADASAASGLALVNADNGMPKVTTPAAAPASYVDVPFTARAGVPYQIWIRMRAAGNSYMNDSIFVQLSGAVDPSGQPVARPGTTQGHAVVLQDYDNAPISGWGWNDNGWAVLGTPYVFAQSGAQTLRIQQREDGIVIDQIVISPAKYLSVPPGAAINDTTVIRP